MKIYPQNSNVLIKTQSAEKETESGVIIPSSSTQEDVEKGVVVAVGKDVKEYKVKDMILFESWATKQVEKDIKIIKEEDILAKVKEA